MFAFEAWFLWTVSSPFLDNIDENYDVFIESTFRALTDKLLLLVCAQWSQKQIGTQDFHFYRNLQYVTFFVRRPHWLANQQSGFCDASHDRAMNVSFTQPGRKELNPGLLLMKSYLAL